MGLGLTVGRRYSSVRARRSEKNRDGPTLPYGKVTGVIVEADKLKPNVPAVAGDETAVYSTLNDRLKWRLSAWFHKAIQARHPGAVLPSMT
ncbi:MAG: hypothetical protein E6Q98_04460 [Rhodospirillaceae bacterium]|nr:MAG: hypothetical protein E6Q98_04460 [Rhodospirillaceae bacterium]